MKTGVPGIDDSEALFVLGSDECGYGSWAGPLFVSAAVVPRDWKGIKGLTDSKKLLPKARERIAAEFKALLGKGTPGFMSYIQYADHDEIDRDGVWKTLHRLHYECVRVLQVDVRTVLQAEPLIVIDGSLKLGIPGAFSLPKADLLVPAVSIASVMGKVAHDAVMREADKLYPGYDFGTAVGYRTERHEEKLAKDGPCRIHRRSYDPVARSLKETTPSTMDDLMSALDAIE